MKPVLLCNITKYNLLEVEALINKYKLLAASVLVDPEAFTPDLEKLLMRYSINVFLPLTSSDGGAGSILDVESRNPGFEERVNAWPKHKLTVVFNTDSPTDKADIQQQTSALLSVAMSFPSNRVIALRGDSQHELHYQIREYLYALGQAQPELTVENVEFETSLRNHYNILDLQFLKEVGVLGGAIHV